MQTIARKRAWIGHGPLAPPGSPSREFFSYAPPMASLFGEGRRIVEILRMGPEIFDWLQLLMLLLSLIVIYKLK